MSVHQYSVLAEKTGPIFTPLVDLMAGKEGGRPADEMRVGFRIFKNLYGLKIQALILFVITAMLLQY